MVYVYKKLSIRGKINFIEYKNTLRVCLDILYWGFIFEYIIINLRVSVHALFYIKKN